MEREFKETVRNALKINAKLKRKRLEETLQKASIGKANLKQKEDMAMCNKLILNSIPLGF
jgi:hypothetical protein